MWITFTTQSSSRYRHVMRWDNLFDDLESQLDHELGAEAVDLRAEAERLRLGRLSLRDRLLAMTGSGEGERGGSEGASSAGIRVLLSSGIILQLRPGTFGRDWLAAELLEESHRRSQCVLALSAIAVVLPTRAQLQTSLSQVASGREANRLTDRLGLAFVLRDLCRRRAAVEVVTATGNLFGTIDRVGRDHLDVAVHESGSPRRETSVSHYQIVPVTQVMYVRL